MTPFRVCTCCNRAISAEQWARLRYVGLQWLDPGHDTRCLELRDCPCGSTLAVLADAPIEMAPIETVSPSFRMEARPCVR